MEIHYYDEGESKPLPPGKEGYVLKGNISLFKRILLKLGLIK